MKRFSNVAYFFNISYYSSIEENIRDYFIYKHAIKLVYFRIRIIICGKYVDHKHFICFRQKVMLNFAVFFWKNESFVFTFSPGFVQ